MKNLHTILPFATDNNGACSVLFDYDALVLCHDMGGSVVRSYLFTENRGKRPIEFGGLPLGEAAYIFGRDSDFVNAYIKIFERQTLKPSFVVLLGSPVSTLSGLDIDALAYEFECRTGVKCFAVRTTGNRYYDKGVGDTMLALYKNFHEKTVTDKQGNANILGLNTLDYPSIQVQNHIKNAVWKSEIQDEINIVASVSGLPLAEYLRKTVSIPYIGLHELDVWGDFQIPIPRSNDEPILIVGEQVFSNVLRKILKNSDHQNVAVASFFEMSDAFLMEQDKKLQCEYDLSERLRDGGYKYVIGDSILKSFLKDMPECKFIPLAHTPVSGNYFRKAHPDEPLDKTWWENVLRK